MAEETFAMACWTLKDIHDHRKEMELPPWSDDETEGWLIANESKMEERMIEAGWDYISLNMS
jgi:hypothetical protein